MQDSYIGFNPFIFFVYQKKKSKPAPLKVEIIAVDILKSGIDGI